MTPASVTGLSIDTAAIAAGAYHTCALTGDGGALCWGDNGHAQLGDGTLTDPGRDGSDGAVERRGGDHRGL